MNINKDELLELVRKGAEINCDYKYTISSSDGDYKRLPDKDGLTPGERAEIERIKYSKTFPDEDFTEEWDKI